MKWNEIKIDADKSGSILQSEKLATWMKSCQQEMFAAELEHL